jgi:hypothetical protein
MKTLLKTFLTTAGVALAASVAQANPNLGQTYTQLLIGGSSAPTTDFSVKSVVTEPLLGLYDYVYTLPSTSPMLDSFSIDMGATAGLGIFNVGSSSALFFGNINGFNVSWTTLPQGTDRPTASVVFSFDSTVPPTWGYAAANDHGSWTGIADADSLVVPGAVPDGGLTMSLLGGTLLGLGALRRKLGC